MFFGGVADFRGGGVRGGEADTVREPTPRNVYTDYSLLCFTGCSEGEAGRTAPFHSSVGGVVPQCALCHADDGAGQRKDRGDLSAMRQGSGRTGGQFRKVPYLRDDYKLQVRNICRERSLGANTESQNIQLTKRIK